MISFLPEITGHLSDKPKFSAGQNENLPVLSYSPAVFAKTDSCIKVKVNCYFVICFKVKVY